MAAYIQDIILKAGTADEASGPINAIESTVADFNCKSSVRFSASPASRTEMSVGITREWALPTRLSASRLASRGRIASGQAALERAMINLVQNAIQHGGRKGTITIRVKPDAAVVVEDEGAGVPPDQRSAIMTRYAAGTTE